MAILSEERDANLQEFLEAAAKPNFTFNKNKCTYSSDCISLLGYQIHDRTLRPDPERVKTLLDIPIPKSKTELSRAIGLFAYYAKWLSRFSCKVKPLVESRTFSLNKNAVRCFYELKSELADTALASVDKIAPFTLETNASDVAVSAVLQQNGRPVAFWSRTLNSNENRYANVEKEAAAIVEAIRRWSHYLLRRKFIITDQNSMAFMFGNSRRNRIKNDKIMRWRMELNQYYDIVYQGKFNVVSDTLSRVYCTAATVNALYRIHAGLCHPGITGMYHYVRQRNLPYSLDDVKRMTSACAICCEIKPKFFKPSIVNLKVRNLSKE